VAVLAPEAAAAFDEIGLPHLARLVAKAMAVLGSEYPRDRDERQARLNELSTGADSSAPFASLDEEFYGLLAKEGGGWEKAADAYAASMH
jgi:hypothetical protein